MKKYLQFGLLFVLCMVNIPTHAAIARTAINTFLNSNGSAATATLASVALSTGDMLVVGCESHASNVSMVTWGSESLSNRDTTNKATWEKIIVTGGTQTITATEAGNSKLACYATKYTGIASSSEFDLVAQAGPLAGTSPTSGTTATISQASEVLIGTVGQDGFATNIGGTWANGFSDGQSTVTTGGSASANSAINEGFLIVSATQTAEAKKNTTTNSGSFFISVTTYKGAAATTCTAFTTITLVGTGCL